MATNIDQNDQTLATLRDNVRIVPPLTFRPTVGFLPVTAIPPVGTNPNSNTPSTPTPATPADPSGKNGIPKQLISVAAVQTPVKQQSFTNSNVTVSFTRDTSDVNFDHVNIWLKGYHGNPNPVLVSGGITSPLNFIIDATKETVTVLAQTVSSAGLNASLDFALSTTVTLSGIVSAPPAPTIS